MSLKTIRLATIADSDIENFQYPVYSLTPLAGVEISKNYKVSPITLMKYNKKKITVKEYQAEIDRQLDARGKHLIEGDLRDCVLVCDCPNNVHKGDCAVKLLRNYIKVKEDIMTLNDMKKIDLQAEWDTAEPEYKKCPDCGTILEDDMDEDGKDDSYCPKCDDIKDVR